MEENAGAKRGMRRARERITWGLRCELEWDPQLGRKTSQEDAEQREEVPRCVRECAWDGLGVYGAWRWSEPKRRAFRNTFGKVWHAWGHFESRQVQRSNARGHADQWRRS